MKNLIRTILIVDLKTILGVGVTLPHLTHLLTNLGQYFELNLIDSLTYTSFDRISLKIVRMLLPM